MYTWHPRTQCVHLDTYLPAPKPARRGTPNAHCAPADTVHAKTTGKRALSKLRKPSRDALLRASGAHTPPTITPASPPTPHAPWCPTCAMIFYGFTQNRRSLHDPTRSNQRQASPSMCEPRKSCVWVCRVLRTSSVVASQASVLSQGKMADGQELQRVGVWMKGEGVGEGTDKEVASRTHGCPFGIHRQSERSVGRALRGSEEKRLRRVQPRGLFSRRIMRSTHFVTTNSADTVQV